MLRLFYCITFRGHIVENGAAAIVVEENAEKAAKLLAKKLRKAGLIGNIQEEDLVEVPLDKPMAEILNDGS